MRDKQVLESYFKGAETFTLHCERSFHWEETCTIKQDITCGKKIQKIQILTSTVYILKETVLPIPASDWPAGASVHVVASVPADSKTAQ